MRQLFRMSDDSNASKAAIPVADRAEAKLWNTPERGFGIFWTCNTFNGPRRKENLTAINAWPIDIDEGDKSAQAKKLMGAPLVPTLIVETKRGYQAYWCARSGAKAEHWNALVLERLVPYFGADKNARDLCRILRVPGSLHLKNPSEPFLCQPVWKHEVSYTERQLAEAFPWVPDRAEHQRALAELQRTAEREKQNSQRASDAASGFAPSESLWDAIWNLDQREALSRLSGSSVVNGERYTFVPTSRNRWNILSDGAGTSCFIDETGKIGSLSGGGPTVVRWCRWLGKGYPEILAALKQAFPHLATIDEAARVSWAAAQRNARAA